MDERARQWGIAAERAVRSAYHRLGYFVVPTHLIMEARGAPMLTGLLQKHVLPDMMVSRGGRSAWREVKFKDHCVKYGKTGFYRHGIDLPKWRAYRKVESKTGIPGGIAVLQFRPGAAADPCPCLLEQTFEHLAATVDIEPAPQPHAPCGMAYWNVDEMERVCWLDFDFTDVPRLTEVVHAWEEKTRDGKTPQMDFAQQQRSLFSYKKNTGGAA
jgi:hypothetical protein